MYPLLYYHRFIFNFGWKLLIYVGISRLLHFIRNSFWPMYLSQLLSLGRGYILHTKSDVTELSNVFQVACYASIVVQWRSQKATTTVGGHCLQQYTSTSQPSLPFFHRVCSNDSKVFITNFILFSSYELPIRIPNLTNFSFLCFFSR